VPTFSDLRVHSRLQDLIHQRGVEAPTQGQAEVIPKVIDNKDVLVCAETGSGKTLAYLLPLFTALLENEKLLAQASPYALILLPTRELADQVYKVCQQLAESSPVKPLLISGGQEFRYQAAQLRRNPEIIVATPGRLLEHIQKKKIDLSNLACLVLDEADRMLDMGFREDVLTIADAVTGSHQSLLLSATLKHRGITHIAEALLDNPEQVILSSARAVNANVKLQMILADDPAHKVRLLLWLLANESYSRVLIFAKTRDKTESVARELQSHRHRVCFLHGEVMQDVRRKIMASFREGRNKIMVATDVAARGLDVDELDLVINLDMAHSGEEFIHRAGRTGRAGASGLVISMISPEDWNLCAGIQKFLSASFEKRKIPGLEGSYKGPKKLKSSGKAAGTKKKKSKSTDKPGKGPIKKVKAKKPGNKVKLGQNKGKAGAEISPTADSGGFAPFKPGKKSV